MKTGRKTKGRGVSLPREISEAVDLRIAQLGPWIRGFSGYVQHLIREDLSRETSQEMPRLGLGKSRLVAIS